MYAQTIPRYFVDISNIMDSRGVFEWGKRDLSRTAGGNVIYLKHRFGHQIREVFDHKIDVLPSSPGGDGPEALLAG